MMYVPVCMVMMSGGLQLICTGRLNAAGTFFAISIVVKGLEWGRGEGD